MFKDDVRRLRALIFTRAALVTLFFGSFYAFRIVDAKLLSPLVFSYFIAVLYFFTIVYAIVLKWINTHKSFVIFAYLQIIIDVFTAAALVALTGGIASWFSFAFLLSIISASTLLSRRASYYIAGMSSVLYGLVIEFQFYFLASSDLLSSFSEGTYLYNIFTHILAFFVVAFLSGHLSGRLSDVTQDLQKKEAYIDDLRMLSKDIIESMPSGVFTTGLNWEIVTFNSSAQAITGLTFAEAIGKKPQDIFSFIDDIKEPYERIEGELVRDGKSHYIGIRFSNLNTSDGMIVGMIGIFQDLTTFKEMELEMRKKEKWAFIGELSALIAHELRNPLASLKASVEMMREKKVSVEHTDKLMGIALSEMDRLNSIVTDFLMYAKPRQPRIDLFDVHKSLNDLITLLRSSENVKENVKITEKLSGELFIKGDADQLHQVFWNLCVNAVESISGSGELVVSTVKKDNSVEIVFRDTGCGVNLEDFERIFYPFVTTKDKGTGLGLAIAHRITEEHGGKLKVESRGKGAGTTFRVVLPLGNPGKNLSLEAENNEVIKG